MNVALFYFCSQYCTPKNVGSYVGNPLALVNTWLVLESYLDILRKCSKGRCACSPFVHIPVGQMGIFMVV